MRHQNNRLRDFMIPKSRFFYFNYLFTFNYLSFNLTIWSEY